MYVLWKTTGDERWRERGWAIFEAIEREAKTVAGYGTVNNVGIVSGDKDNSMPRFVGISPLCCVRLTRALLLLLPRSFFLAET